MIAIDCTHIALCRIKPKVHTHHLSLLDGRLSLLVKDSQGYLKLRS